MGLFDRIKNAVNPDRDDLYDDDLEYDDPADGDGQYYNDGYHDQQTQAGMNPGGQTMAYNQIRTQYAPHQGGNPMNQMHNVPMSIESHTEIKVIRSDSFDIARPVADHLLNKRTVVLNLDTAKEEVIRNILYFLQGVVYSIDGSIKKVAARTFIITPNTVPISDQGAASNPQAHQVGDMGFNTFGS
jgi:cell division inhibitor SepF